jgi:hypothetical protein
MATARKPTTEAATAPPPYHNAPELAALSLEEHASIEAARNAFTTLKRTLDHWMTIGKGLQVLHAKAERLNAGRGTFKRLRELAGLGEKAIPKSTVTRLFAILDNLPAVTEWQQGLTDKQKYDWASPISVHRHCPVFKKQKSDDEKSKLSPMAQLKQANIALQEENHRLKQQQRKDGDCFKPTDTAKDIATALVGTLSGFPLAKARRVALHMLEIIKERKKAKRKEHNENDHEDENLQAEPQERWIES